MVSLVAQLVKSLPTGREIWVPSLGLEDPLPLAIRCVHGTKFSSKLFENVQLPTPLLGPLCAGHNARLTAAWL